LEKLTEQNFYELLGIEFNASSFEINRAYKEMCQLYHEDSLASYSFFSREDREDILAKLEEAHATLINEEKRSQYDQILIDSGVFKEEMQSQDERKTLGLRSDSKHPTNYTILEIRKELKATVSSNVMIQEILNHDGLMGEDLKRIRDELGISLEAIAEMTKIRIVFLRAIEEEELDKVPSRMFLKSFLKAYAESIGLDAANVASRYLKRMDDRKGSDRSLSLSSEWQKRLEK
jgi:transcriptional regulator with XRE-family HTH domain